MGLHELYYAESQITKTLPEIIDLATNHDLQSCMRLHLDETQKQIERLEQAYAKLSKQPSTAAYVDGTSALDAAIVATAQAIRNLTRLTLTA